MRRLEMLPNEAKEIEEALSRAATPTHETIEFTPLAVLQGLQAAEDALRVVNKFIPDNIVLGEE